jgi:hypothetical protein
MRDMRDLLRFKAYFQFNVTFNNITTHLEIETGRWYNIPKDERFCTLCGQSIGDECHLLLIDE